VLKRFKQNLSRACVREIRFHEYADVLVMPTFASNSSQLGLIAA